MLPKHAAGQYFSLRGEGLCDGLVAVHIDGTIVLLVHQSFARVRAVHLETKQIGLKTTLLIEVRKKVTSAG